MRLSAVSVTYRILNITKKNYMSDSIISVNKIISKMFFQEPIYVLDDRKNLK